MRRRQEGFIDPLSLIGLAFLVVTLLVGTVAVNKQNANYDIRDRAYELEDEELNFMKKAQKTKIISKQPAQPTTTTTPPPVTAPADNLEPEEGRYTQQLILPSPTPTPVTIIKSDYQKCLDSGNTPSECAPVAQNVGKTVTTQTEQQECTPGIKLCSGSNLKICSNSGTWGLQTCANGCENGACKVAKKAEGQLCDSDSECQSGQCFASGAYYQGTADANGLSAVALAGSVKRCHTATPQDYKMIQDAENKGNLAAAALAGGLMAGVAVIPPILTTAGTTVTATGLTGAWLTATNIPNAIYSNTTAALSSAPAWVQTAGNVLNLAQGPLAVIACQTQGADSPACQMGAAGITSEFFNNPVGTLQSLQSSAQQVQSVTQAGLANLQTSANNWVSNQIDEAFNFGYTTNAPDMKGSVLENNLIEDFYGIPGSSDTETAKLIKYVTGLDFTDPDLPDLLVNDINIIRAKYNLPPREMLFDNPSEYQRQLTALVQREAGTEILPSWEKQIFFENTPAGGVFENSNNTIAVKYPRYDLYPENPQQTLNNRNLTLTHEVVHALQNQRYPSMPIEIMEYEAYLSEMGQNWLLNKASPTDIADILFAMRINGSVSWWYKEQGLIPSWISP